MQPMSFGLSRRSFLASSVALGFAGAARAADTIKPDAKAALIVTDVQNCFVDGGTLPVKGGADIVPIINKLAPAFAEHRHHPGLAHAGPCLVRVGPSRQEAVRDDAARLTARRCCGPTTASRAPRTQPCSRTSSCRRRSSSSARAIHTHTDSYSAFMEADGKTATGLSGYFKERGIDTLFLTGLATDFCVAWSAVDARKFGFTTYVIEDATRAIDLNGSLAAAWKQMTDAGVKRIQSADIQTA